MALVKVTQRDLDQVMNLEDWLSATNKALNAHSLKDAWAHGDTDCAFHINDVVGIQNSNRGNDWRIWGGSRGDLAQIYHDNGKNYGTYFNLQSENMIQEVMSQTDWKISADRSQVIDNRTGDTDIEYTYTTTESQTAVREVTVTNAISVAMEAEFKAFDVGVKVSATYEHTNATMDGNTMAKESGQSVTNKVGPGKYAELHSVTRQCEKRYQVRVPIVMEGWVGLCTDGDPNSADGDRTKWNTFLPLYDFVSKDKVTHWLSLEMNVDSTDVQVIAHNAPTKPSVSKEMVEKELAAAKEPIKPSVSKENGA